jgi:Undecaprenyl-phosphate glucose phosphotransferase
MSTMRDDIRSISASDSRTPASRRSFRGSRRPVSLPVAANLLSVLDTALLTVSGIVMMSQASLLRASDWRFYTVLVLLGATVGTVSLRLSGAYLVETIAAGMGGASRAGCAWTLSVALLAGLIALIGARPSAATWLVLWLIAGVVLLAAERQGLALLLKRWRESGRLCRGVAVLGAGPLGERVCRQLEAADQSRIFVVGIYDDRPVYLARQSDERAFGGAIDDLLEDVASGAVDDVVIALPTTDDRRLSMAMQRLSTVPVDVRLYLPALSVAARSCSARRVGGLPLLDLMAAPLRDWRGVVKTIEDRIIAALALLLFGPLMLFIALLIKADSPGPVLFRQKRVGFNNRVFDVLKFRTMYADSCDLNAECLTRRNDPRVTRLGAFLRSTMLDELPQLVNVLRGEMSIVGPRPHALRAKAGGMLYRDAVPHYDARHRMRPGITGWAQVNGWHGTTDTIEQIEKRVEHDLEYIDRWSIGFDLAIMLRTMLLPFAALRGR